MMRNQKKYGWKWGQNLKVARTQDAVKKAFSANNPFGNELEKFDIEREKVLTN